VASAASIGAAAGRLVGAQFPRPKSGPAAGAPITGRDAWAGDVPIGWCRMRPEDDGDLVLLVELGNTFPRPTQGFAGWEVVDLPGGVGMTHWKGHDPISIDLELFFNDDDLTNSVEDAIATLEAMAGRGIKRKKDEPSVVKVDTGGLMPFDWHQFPDTRWVINGLDYSTDPEQVIVNPHGNRVRQTVTVTLLQHVDDQRLQSRSFTTAKPATHRTYTTKKGDTLQSIANGKLGSSAKWKTLAKLNPSVRDPRHIKAGTKIRLS
jgi:LysM repeat protein